MGDIQLLAPLGVATCLLRRDMMKRYSFFLIIFLSISLLTACSNSAIATSASSPTKVASGSTPTPTKIVITAPIVGTYITTITQKDIAANPDLASDLGTHTLIFKNDGTYSWKLHTPANSTLGSFNIAGSYQVAQGEMSMKDALCANYLNAPGAGTYIWQLKGNNLTMQLKSDDCVDRKLVFTLHPLVKQDS